jgi:hypothetical protein
MEQGMAGVLIEITVAVLNIKGCSIPGGPALLATRSGAKHKQAKLISNAPMRNIMFFIGLDLSET